MYNGDNKIKSFWKYKPLLLSLYPVNKLMETLTNNLRDKNKQYWFVIGSRNHMKELQIRDEARNKGLEAFVPVIYAYKVIRGQKQRKLIPAINGFVFVKATTTEMEELILKSKFTIYHHLSQAERSSSPSLTATWKTSLP